MKPAILVVDDDVAVCELLQDVLSEHVFTVLTCHTGQDAVNRVQQDPGIALVLLDMMLPDGHGLDLLRQMRRARNAVPVIILTAMDRITDRIDGLNAGADDYLVKPFDLFELTARIGAVARRYARDPSPHITVAGFEVNLAGRQITGPEGAIDLGLREWIIFETLVQAKGAIVPKLRLEDRLYSFDAEVESNTIEVYVSRLRKKLGKGTVETLRGLGYRIAR